MTELVCQVNGGQVRAEVTDRTSLADFLREQLSLTGTHLGCEQGVCGACTLLLDDQPVRSCLTLAVVCQDRRIETIEGLEQDPVMERLRAAFIADHALQCGYCTPGMLVTARDIILRLKDADDDRIRLELAGNLCRCTGYNGIVRAIRRVLDQGPIVKMPPRTILPERSLTVTAPAAPPQSVVPAGGDAQLRQTLTLDLPLAQIWSALQDPTLIAGCVPGAMVTDLGDGRLSGEMQAALGPIKTRFAGEASIRLDADQKSGTVSGQGRDLFTGTRLTAEMRFQVTAVTPKRSEISLSITYGLQGALAQFGRGPVVRIVAAEIAEQAGRAFEAKLRGENLRPISRLVLIGRIIRRLFQGRGR
jgi:carbon-monoxide dehydrogenase small subunit